MNRQHTDVFSDPKIFSAFRPASSPFERELSKCSNNCGYLRKKVPVVENIAHAINHVMESKHSDWMRQGNNSMNRRVAHMENLIVVKCDVNDKRNMT